MLLWRDFIQKCKPAPRRLGKHCSCFGSAKRPWVRASNKTLLTFLFLFYLAALLICWILSFCCFFFYCAIQTFLTCGFPFWDLQQLLKIHTDLSWFVLILTWTVWVKKCFVFWWPMWFMLSLNKISKQKDHQLQIAQHPFLLSVEQLLLLDFYLHFLKAELLKFLSNEEPRVSDMFLILSV